MKCAVCSSTRIMRHLQLGSGALSDHKSNTQLLRVLLLFLLSLCIIACGPGDDLWDDPQWDVMVEIMEESIVISATIANLHGDQPTSASPRLQPWGERVFVLFGFSFA